LVWNWGVAISFIGPSAHGLDGGNDAIWNGARLSRNPMIMNGIEMIRDVLRLDKFDIAAL
jgi:hypothetical protein